MSLQYEFVTMFRSIREYLAPRELMSLEAAGIMLFELRPRMSIDKQTGMHLLKVTLDDVLARNEVRAGEPLLSFYEKACRNYGIAVPVLKNNSTP
jgi:hypothetical protein